jgi:ribosomal protein S18 acetylase RimI-like enzyme
MPEPVIPILLCASVSLNLAGNGGDGGARCLQVLADPQSITLICQDDSTHQPLGFVAVVFWEGSPYLYAIAVKEESRRSGIGSALIQECCLRVPLKFGC